MNNPTLLTCQHGIERRAWLHDMQHPRFLRNILAEVRMNFPGAIVSGLAVSFVVVAVIVMPPLDDAANKAAQAKAEAHMKARLFTKYPDSLLADAERMTFPVSAYPKEPTK